MTINFGLSLAIIVVLVPLALFGVLGLGKVVLVHELAEVVVILNGVRAARVGSSSLTPIDTEPCADPLQAEKLGVGELPSVAEQVDHPQGQQAKPSAQKGERGTAAAHAGLVVDPAVADPQGLWRAKLSVRWFEPCPFLPGAVVHAYPPSRATPTSLPDDHATRVDQ